MTGLREAFLLVPHMLYWKLHIGDWSKATVHLSLSEVGAYVRLLNYYYEKECPLPPEPDKLARIVGATGDKDKATMRRVLAEFFVEHPDGWYHDRVNREVATAHKKSASRKEAAEERWRRQREAAGTK